MKTRLPIMTVEMAGESGRRLMDSQKPRRKVRLHFE
jgi:hypothetical protein